jgi:hypothetical protein
LWEASRDKAKEEKTEPLKIRWGSEHGYVQITNIVKALGVKTVLCPIRRQVC